MRLGVQGHKSQKVIKMSKQIIENMIQSFLKSGKSKINFRQTGDWTPDQVIDGALKDEEYPGESVQSFKVNDVLIESAYIPKLHKTVVAFKYDNKNMCGYISDGEIDKINEKEKLKNTEIHSLIRESEGKFYIAIPFELKDLLKKAISSAKFEGSTKEWCVGSRSGKKLSAWVSGHEAKIIEAQQKKTAKKNKLAGMARVDVSGVYDIKDELKERFGAEFGELNGEKSWFVELEVYEECVEYSLKRLKEIKIAEQAIVNGNNLEEVAKVLDSILDDFEIFRENEKHRPLGYSAYYRGINPNIVDLINKAAKHFKSNPKMLPKKINDSLKNMAGDRLSTNQIFPTLFYYVFWIIRDSLNKGLAFTDENDTKFLLWPNQNVILDLIAKDILEFIGLDAEVDVDFES